jgi:RNA polymerase sigma-70 factor (TIGR02943 family)
MTEYTALPMQWIDEYSDTLFTWALHKTGNRNLAEDLVQDTYLAAVIALPQFESKSSPKTWLFSILNNKIIDYYRKEYRKNLPRKNNSDEYGDQLLKQNFSEDGHWNKEAAPKEWKADEEHLLDNESFNNQMADCMNKLPAHWKAALQLKFLEEKKGEEICQELEITPTNFWQILHRAKVQLRKCIELNWFAVN